MIGTSRVVNKKPTRLKITELLMGISLWPYEGAYLDTAAPPPWYLRHLDPYV